MRSGGVVGCFVVAVAIGAGVAIRTWNFGRPARLLAEARAATSKGDRAGACAAWHAWNATDGATAATLLVEAQLAADLNRGRDAERIARQVIQLDASSASAWTLRINRLRVLDQPIEALTLGLSALGGIRSAEFRRAILKATTLATLAEVPDADARGQLDRWIAADPADLDAQVARLTWIAANPHPGDSDRAIRIVELQGIVAGHPDHVAARDALGVALGDSGEVARGQAILDGWPLDQPASHRLGAPGGQDRGYRFDRLQGRWDLEFNHQPGRAAARFRAACLVAPHDWKSHYGLARALQATGHAPEARAEALAVTRLRERLDPATLGPRLTTAFAQLDGGTASQAAGAMADLAALGRSVGLVELADAWDQAARGGPASGAQASLAPPP